MQSQSEKKQDLFGFSNQGKNYDQVRPTYPISLLKKALSSTVQSPKNYLDFATGTGQILFQLAPNFSGSQIIGNDISEKQINVAKEKAFTYNKENSQNIQLILSDFSEIEQRLEEQNYKEKFDLITMGQALHWLDRDKFLSISQNLLSKEGSLCIFGYFAKGFKYCFEDKEFNERGQQRYDRVYGILDPNFDFDRKELELKYTEKDKYPFEKYYSSVEFVDTEEIKKGKLGDYIRYIKTFSAYNTYIERFSQNKDYKDPVEEMIEDIISDMKSDQKYEKYADNINDIDISFRNEFFIYILKNPINHNNKIE